MKILWSQTNLYKISQTQKSGQRQQINQLLFPGRRVLEDQTFFEQLQATILRMLSHSLIKEMKYVHKATDLSILITANVHIEVEPTNILKKPLILHPAFVKTLLPYKVTAIDTGIRKIPINKSITDRLAMKMLPTRTLGFVR